MSDINVANFLIFVTLLCQLWENQPPCNFSSEWKSCLKMKTNNYNRQMTTWQVKTMTNKGSQLSGFWVNTHAQDLTNRPAHAHIKGWTLFGGVQGLDQLSLFKDSNLSHSVILVSGVAYNCGLFSENLLCGLAGIWFLSLIKCQCFHSVT